MNVKIYPGRLDGILNAPPSKSSAIRYFICAYLSNEKTKINLNKTCSDIDAIINALKSLGVKIEYTDGAYTLYPHKKVNNVEINAGESASVLRFLLPILSAKNISAKFYGEKSLINRPIKELLEVLKGVKYSSTVLPIKTEGQLKSGEYKIKGDVSSQYVSGLLFALPLLDKDSKIVIDGVLESKPYVDLTVGILKEFGIKVEENEYGYYVFGNQKYSPVSEINIEGDYSSASFFLGGNIIGNRVRVLNLNPNGLEPDRKINEYLLKFNFKGTVLDLKNNPDLVPILSVCSAFSCSKTEIKGIKRLRYKECDRIKALEENLTKLGINVRSLDDSLIIEGKGKVKGGVTVNGYFDHRIIMAMAILGTMAENPIIIKSAENVDKSYPDFFNDFVKLGGKIDVI